MAVTNKADYYYYFMPVLVTYKTDLIRKQNKVAIMQITFSFYFSL